MNVDFRGASGPSQGTRFCAVHDLDLDGAWLFWSASPSPQLYRSLELQGQMQPVLVDGSGLRPVLVAGHARCVCLADLEREVWCVDVGRLDDWSRGVMYLHSNAGREIGDAELLRALRYFHLLDAGRLAEIAPLLGVEMRSKRLRLALAWLTLPLVWDATLEAARVPLACADLLAAMSSADLEAVAPLFADLAWSRGNAVNVLSWLRETALRDGLSLADVLARVAPLSADLSPKDAMARITAAVRGLRYPVLTAMESGFGQAVRQASAGTGWKILQPDQFESDAVEFSVRVSSRAGLARAAGELVEVAARDECDRLFSGVGR